MTNNVNNKTVAIVGGGPAGLMAAQQLAQSGCAVTVYDHMPSIGRKFLMAGRGGLNLTHSEALPDFLARYGAAQEWLTPAITAFPPDALRAWCEKLGQKTFVGSSGRIFPTSMKASPLLRAWLAQLDQYGVRFALRHRWLGWDSKGALRFINADNQESAVQADAAILALGGASWPRLGSDGNWVQILHAEGVEIAKLLPANVGFIAPWSTVFAGKHAGTPLKPVTVSFAGASVQGELMITEAGLEGGAIYSLARSIRDAIIGQGEAVITLDLRPGHSLDVLTQKLHAPRGSQSLATFLRKAAGLSPAAIGLLRETTHGVQLPTQGDALARLIKNAPIRLTATAGMARAISSAGGVTRNAVDQHFRLKNKSGVFVIGEMLDWEAPTGGYLLQACFSTAVTAAKEIIES